MSDILADVETDLRMETTTEYIASVYNNEQHERVPGENKIRDLVITNLSDVLANQDEEEEDFHGFDPDPVHVTVVGNHSVDVHVDSTDGIADKPPAPAKKKGRPPKIYNFTKVKGENKVADQGEKQYKLTKTGKRLGRRPKSAEPAPLPKSDITPTSLIPLLENRQPRRCKRSMPWIEVLSDMDTVASAGYKPEKTPVEGVVKRKRGRPKSNNVTVLSLPSSSDTDNTSWHAKKPVTEEKLKKIRGKYKKRAVIGIKRQYNTKAKLEMLNKVNQNVSPKVGRPRKNTSYTQPLDSVVYEVDKKKSTRFDETMPIVQPVFSENSQSVLLNACKCLYTMGWAAGGTGGISLKLDGKVHVVGSGVDKSCVDPTQIVSYSDPTTSGKIRNLDDNHSVMVHIHKLKKAGVVLYSQNEEAVLASLIYHGSEFRITHQEMMRNIKHGQKQTPHSYDDILAVPIMENVLSQSEIAKRMEFAIEMYPNTNAVVIRRHGLYLWGETWPIVKSQAESLQYLFRLAIKMKQIGFEPDHAPRDEYGISY